MPKVYVMKDGKKISDGNNGLKSFLGNIQEIVSEAMSCDEESTVRAESVGVEVSNFGKLDIFNKHLEIRVVGIDTPARRKNTVGIINQIKGDIIEHHGKFAAGFSVWLQLLPGGYTKRL